MGEISYFANNRRKEDQTPDRQDGAQAPPEALQARLSACASTSSWSRSAHAPQPPSPYSVGLSWRVLKRQPHPDDHGRCCYLQLHHRLHPTARARFLSATRCSRSGYLHLLASPSTRSHHSSTPASWAACAARVRWQAQLWRVSGAATRTWSLGATHLQDGSHLQIYRPRVRFSLIPYPDCALPVAVFNLVSKSFNFLSPTTTSLVAAEADSGVGLERGVFTPPMAVVASSALTVALCGGALIGAGMSCCASPLLAALGVPLRC